MSKFLIFLFLSLFSSIAFACPPCPSGASTSGSGATTSLAGCRCNDGTYTWNGSICVAPVTCIAGSSTSGAGANASPAGCKCINGNEYFNGFTCYVPTCSDGALRADPANPFGGLAQICQSGLWVARSLSTYCTPPWDVHAPDDGDANFHQMAFAPQNSSCQPWQTEDTRKASVSGFYVHGDDGDTPCSNTLNCLQHNTQPTFNGACPAAVIGWTLGGNQCYGSVASISSGASTGIFDSLTDPTNGYATAVCKSSVWVVSPGKCDAAPYQNCTSTLGPYSTVIDTCIGGAFASGCCDAAAAGGYCTGFSASCP